MCHISKSKIQLFAHIFSNIAKALRKDKDKKLISYLNQVTNSNCSIVTLVKNQKFDEKTLFFFISLSLKLHGHLLF